MEKHHLYALRLGFNTKNAGEIASAGLENYITTQLNAINKLQEPGFMLDVPKTAKQLKTLKEKTDSGSLDKEKLVKEFLKIGIEWKAFVLQRCYETEFPLREKINLFFHNHFVSTLQSVKMPYWIYLHYKSINDFSLSNYKTLVKEMLYSNAVLKYLDNNQNKQGKVNENLARELLELFTLGEGHYTENDVKQAALALAGLGFGETKGEYRPKLKNNDTKVFLGKSGNFDANDIVDIIFEQPNTAYFITEKILKWFFYDNPEPQLIEYYGGILLKFKYELKPFFENLFINECLKQIAGTQIKNPLQFLMQLFNDLNLQPNYTLMTFFLKNQGMDIYDQPNVKGWKGGQDWLSSQLYTNRNQFVDFIITGNKQYMKMLSRKLEKFDGGVLELNPNLKLKNKKNAQSILEELTERTIFETNEEMWNALNQLMKYDFDVKAPNANQNILNVYAYLAKTPEFQII
jgi:uncharacterized protein (DUF1800 family)